tara:strand:- start:63 stop:995 length:933 start_codon:yes stop_codon:yes gene_type:complete
MNSSNSIWDKLGLIYSLDNSTKNKYLLTHTSNPTALQIGPGLFRVFFSGRDAQNRSSVSAFDLDMNKYKVINDFKKPLLKFNQNSNFFPDGISCSSIYEVKNTQYLTFMGWINKKNEHWRGLIGRVQLGSDFEIQEDSSEILLNLNEIDKVSLSYPYIISEEGLYKMYYGSTIDWDYKNGEMLHVINYAESNDGHNFNPKGLAFPYIEGVAQAFSRPTILVRGYEKHAWFSYRGGNGDKYKIGYAFSKEKNNWNLNLSKNTIFTSNEGWDCEMIEYPFVFEYNKEIFMLYNGNQYGKTGIGLAVMKNNQL